MGGRGRRREAFCGPCVMSLDGLQFVHEALCRRQAGYDMGISVSPFPYGSFIAAGGM